MVGSGIGMSKKDLLASILGWAPVHGLLQKLLVSSRIKILAYHRVLDFSESDYPFDEELISASVEQFDKQMRHLSENYSVITFFDLLQIEAGRASLPKNPLIITFDDGYSDNYANAYPILKKYGLPAVFFVSTDYIGARNPFWFEQIIYAGKKGLFDNDDIRNLFPEGLSENETNSLDYARNLRWKMMNLSNRERLAMMEIVESVVSEKLTSSEFEHISTMSWDNLCEMANNGMEIGSHTKSHLILTQASSEELVDELSSSKAIIEEHLQEKVVSISYPVGNKNFMLTGEMLENVRDAGYQWGISYVSGCEQRPYDNRYLLKRLKVERYTTFDSFKAKLLMPDLFK